MGNNYQQYVIDNGKFIGKFEEMYQECDDPWHQDEEPFVYMELAMALLKFMGVSPRTILDIGCGKGNYTAYVKSAFPSVHITAFDISPTAIRIAKRMWHEEGIQFRFGDARHVTSFIDGKYDLIIASELLWYILPQLHEFIGQLRWLLTEEGYLLVLQHFYAEGVQKYGNEYMGSYEDLLEIFRKSDFEDRYTLEATRFTNHDTVTVFRKTQAKGMKGNG